MSHASRDSCAEVDFTALRIKKRDFRCIESECCFEFDSKNIPYFLEYDHFELNIRNGPIKIRHGLNYHLVDFNL